MPANIDISPRQPTRKAAERFAELHGYHRVGKHFMSGNRFAVIQPMPASGTFKVIMGVPV